MIYVIGISIWVSFHLDDPKQTTVFLSLLAVIIPHFIWLLHQDKYKFREVILSIAIALGICLGITQITLNLSKIWLGFSVVIISSMATFFYFLGIWKFKNISTNWQKPLDIFGKLCLIIIIFVLTFSFPWELIKNSQFIAKWDLSWFSLLDYFWALLLIGITMLMFFCHIKQKKFTESLFGTSIILAIIGCGFATTSALIPQLLFNTFMFIASISHIIAGIRTNSFGIVNMGMLMFAALTIARFFDSEISFIVKGLVFMAIGTGFLLTNVIIIRRKKVSYETKVNH